MKANELKATDLMIGDWLMFNGEPCQVRGLHNDDTAIFVEYRSLYCLIDAEPMPLTPEILEKNGFNDTSFEANHKHKYVIHTNEYQLGYYPKTNSFNVYKKGIDPFYTKDVFCCGFQNIVKYVHELQHALKLCGIDKEIVI